MNSVPSDVLTHLLPWLGPSDIGSYRLVNHRFLGAADEAIKDIRDWILDFSGFSRYGHVHILRRAVQRVPVQENNLYYVARVFSVVNHFLSQQACDVNHTVPSLGFSLETVEEQNKIIRSEYLNDILNELNSIVIASKRPKSFEEIRRDCFTTLDAEQRLDMLKAAIKLDCVEVFEHFFNLGELPSLSTADIQQIFLLAAEFGSCECMKKLLKSSQGACLEVHYKALEIAKSHGHKQCIGLLCPPIQRTFLKSYVIELFCQIGVDYLCAIVSERIFIQEYRITSLPWMSQLRMSRFLISFGMMGLNMLPIGVLPFARIEFRMLLQDTHGSRSAEIFLYLFGLMIGPGFEPMLGRMLMDDYPDAFPFVSKPEAYSLIMREISSSRMQQRVTLGVFGVLSTLALPWLEKHIPTSLSLPWLKKRIPIKDIYPFLLAGGFILNELSGKKLSRISLLTASLYFWATRLANFA